MRSALLRRGAFPISLALALVLPPLAGRLPFNPHLTGYGAFLAAQAGCFVVAAIARNLLMGYAGQISLGHFALLGVGAFTSGIVTGADRLALPLVVAVPAAAAMGALVALVVGFPALRLRGLSLAIVTIAFAYAMQNSVFRSHFLSKGSGGAELPRPQLGTYILDRNDDFLAVVLVLLVVVWFVDRNVTSTKLGRAFHAVRSDEAVAASFGVDVARSKLLAFALSGAFAGVAGLLYGHLTRTVSSLTFGYDQSLLLVIIVVVGGLGSRSGVAVSAVFYALFETVLIKLFGSGFHGIDLIVGALLLMYTVSRHPGGLAQVLAERRARRGPAADADDDGDGPAPKLPELPRPSGLPDRPAATPVVLEATEISVRFGGLQAVNGASLRVPRGRIVGLIGPNGAGKTTLFNAISGARRPDAGRVHLLGQDVSELPAHARARLGLGRTFQLIGLAKSLSVTEHLLLAQHVVAGYPVASALTMIGSSRRVERELRQRAADAVEALGFGEHADTPVQRLSHGQQRIVELGCVLVTAPELVMLDEPSAGMSPGAAENLAVRLRDIRDELGRTVLLIEHNIPLVLDVCDELYVLDAGRMLASGDPDEVVRRPEVVEAYLGGPALGSPRRASGGEAGDGPTTLRRRRTRAGVS